MGRPERADNLSRCERTPLRNSCFPCLRVEPGVYVITRAYHWFVVMKKASKQDFTIGIVRNPGPLRFPSLNSLHTACRPGRYAIPGHVVALRRADHYRLPGRMKTADNTVPTRKDATSMRAAAMKTSALLRIDEIECGALACCSRNSGSTETVYLLRRRQTIVREIDLDSLRY